MQKQLFVYLAVVVFLASSNVVSGQVTGIGKCPKGIQTVQNFDASKYVDTWFEYSAYDSVFKDGRCTQAQYAAISENTISVNNTEINKKDELVSILGKAKVVGPGKLSVRFDGLASLSGDADYWVVGTDYTTYAAVYSCKEILFTNLKFAWLLTRDRVPSQAVVDKALKAFADQGISVNDLHKTEQSNC